MIGQITNVFQNNKASPLYATAIGQVVNGELVIWWEGLVEIPLGVTNLTLPTGMVVSTVADSTIINNENIISISTTIASTISESGSTSISAYVAVSPIPKITIRRIAWTKGTFIGSPTFNMPIDYVETSDYKYESSANIVQLTDAIMGRGDPLSSKNTNTNILNIFKSAKGRASNPYEAHALNNVLNYIKGNMATGHIQETRLIQNGMQKVSGKTVDILSKKHNNTIFIPSLYKSNTLDNLQKLTNNNIESTYVKAKSNIVNSNITNTVNYSEILTTTNPTTTKLFLKTGVSGVSCAITKSSVTETKGTIDTTLISEIDVTNVVDLDDILIN